MTKTQDIRLDSDEEEVLAQLFVNGPTWDGNLISKSGRNGLAQLDLIDRLNGWQWLNEAGMRYVLSMDFKGWVDQRPYRKQKMLS